MRRAARIDSNQPEIVNGLRKIGCSVQSLAPVGEGCPDLLVGHRGNNFLIEVKDGARIPSEQKLTPDQIDWHSDWRGRVHVARSLEEVIRIVRPPI